MSSENQLYPNQGINQINSEVRLAYYVYTWDSTGKTKQKTAWSTIGSYTLNEYSDIVYTSNKNQLIKTNGSNGVSVVGDNFGVIVNNGSDVGPSILKIDGTYITALDNLANTTSYSILHREISTVDPHYIISSGINTLTINYTDLWGQSTSYNINSGTSYFPFSAYSANTVVEPVELAVIGKDSHGINAITNKGFIYNNVEYQRNINIMNYYTELWNYFKNWQYGSNVYSVENYGDSSMEFAPSSSDGTSSVTALNDFDISVIQNYANIFKQCYDNNSNIVGVNQDYVQGLSNASVILSNIAYTINDLMGNFNDDGSTATEIPLNLELFRSGYEAIETWSTTKNLTDLWENQHTAIVMEKLPINSTFMYFSQISNATSIIGMNNKTKEWIDLTLPVSDQSYEIIMRNVVNNNSGTYTLADMSQFVNNYYISYGPNGEILSTSSQVVNILTSQTTSGSLDVTMSTEMFIINEDKSFTWTSNVYFLQNNNLNNSGSTFRFIGLESTGNPYYNTEGSNSIKITGFNKILLNDLYENPNTYQNADITYYYSNASGIGSTTNVLEIDGNLTSYSVSLVSAIQKDQNVLIGGCGSDGYEHTTGSPGVFYIPLPSEIDRDDDNAYVDTHWMLTTWTPNILSNATERGINNNQNVLYKYTKMNDLITTGLYGGFTPYYDPASDITAGLLTIPQISYGTSSYGSPIYVTSSENDMAKLSMIMYSSNADGVTFPTGGTIQMYNSNKSTILGTFNTPIGNIAPEYNSNDPPNSDFYKYFNTYKQYAACVFTLNSNEREIILNTNMMNNSQSVGNVAYLDLIGYPDEEFDNLSFDVERKYIFTFNAHIQVTNLNLLSDQINYGVPSLLLIGHFRNRYCKQSLKTGGSNILYPGRDVFIPLLNKPLENPVNNIYNIEGTYTLSWNTTGSGSGLNNITGYQMYIPQSGKSYNTTGETFGEIWEDVFGASDSNPAPIISTDLAESMQAGNILHFENVLDRIYAFILTGETVNNNLVYQFVNNTTYQNGDLKLLSGNDLDLITGNVANNISTTSFNTSAIYNPVDSNVIITIAGNKQAEITCPLNTENKFTNINIDLPDGNTKVFGEPTEDGNSMTLTFENAEGKQSDLVGVEITVSLNLNSNGEIVVSVYDNHILFALENTGIDSGILGINEPMLSMTIQRY